MGTSVDKSKLEFEGHPPIWCRALTEEEENQIRAIYKFFVVDTPCKDISAMSISFTQYGWSEDNPPKDGYLQKRLCDSAGLVQGATLFIGERREDMKALFVTAAMDANFGSTYDVNRIAVLINGNFIIELFRNLRNSFAHCRFTLRNIQDDILFIMENGSVSGASCEVKARMVIKKTTLEEWIRIIQNEASTEKAILKAERDKLIAQIVEAISTDEIRSIAQLAEVTGIEKQVIEKVIKDNKHIVAYSRHLKKWMLLEAKGEKL